MDLAGTDVELRSVGRERSLRYFPRPGRERLRGRPVRGRVNGVEMRPPVFLGSKPEPAIVRQPAHECWIVDPGVIMRVVEDGPAPVSGDADEPPILVVGR